MPIKSKAQQRAMDAAASGGGTGDTLSVPSGAEGLAIRWEGASCLRTSS